MDEYHARAVRNVEFNSRDRGAARNQSPVRDGILVEKQKSYSLKCRQA
jgi:hypothetical protein